MVSVFYVKGNLIIKAICVLKKLKRPITFNIVAKEATVLNDG